ncbi:MAG: hypothetical protein FVQ04_01990 [Nitrospira sp.]|nr:hypothetical protein [Nitrospira sp.]
MYRTFMKTLTCALAILFVASTLAFAGGQKNSGVIVAVAKEVVVIKGADGKTYEIEAVRIIEEDLKTGDIVEYDLVEGRVLNVKKTKKK